MALRPHRRSFWFTTIFAVVATIVAVVALAATAIATHRGVAFHVLPTWAARLAWALVGLVVVAIGTVTATVAIGGIAVLHRDACEERGLPYRPTRPRERSARPLFTKLRRTIKPRTVPRAGEVVEVRTLPEILATLDDHGCLDGLPFMPEMVAFCGQRVAVLRRVDKVWEYAHNTGLRRMRHAVLLRTMRCSGDGHGGCQSSCHLIWKVAWLRWPDEAPAVAAPPRTTHDLDAYSQVSTPDGTRYVCQGTQIREASEPLRFTSLSHYWRDLVGGNIRLCTLLVEFGIRAFNAVLARLGRQKWPVLQPLATTTTPITDLQLQPGQLVRVRTKREIEQTLSHDLRNRGLSFSGDLLADCGGSYRVAVAANRVIREATGELLSLKHPVILLEGGHSMGGPLLIPQNEYYFWREIWLDPVPTPD